MKDDQQAMEQNITAMLYCMGEDPDREGLVETPKRVAKAWFEMTSGYQQDAAELLSKTFESSNRSMVICKEIEFYSSCEHHLLPFIGKCHIGYIPNGKVVGISKLVRLVEMFARRLQIQENMTDEIADAIMQHLQPQGCAVVIEAQHLCMKARGVRNHSSVMVTSALRGLFQDRDVRSEFLSLIGAK